MNNLTITCAALCSILFFSCGMGWENGGKEEFRTHCVGDAKTMLGDFDYENNEFKTVDIDKTCDCVIEKTMKEYPDYEDALMNKYEFIEGTIKLCAAANSK